MLRFVRFGVVILEEKIVDVVAHGQGTCLLIVVPGKVDAGKLHTCPVRSNRVVLLECVKEVICMSLTNKLEAKVVDDENK